VHHTTHSLAMEILLVIAIVGAAFGGAVSMSKN
jgi:hypothetical protein